MKRFVRNYIIIISILFVFFLFVFSMLAGFLVLNGMMDMGAAVALMVAYLLTMAVVLVFSAWDMKKHAEMHEEN